MRRSIYLVLLLIICTVLLGRTPRSKAAPGTISATSKSFTRYSSPFGVMSSPYKSMTLHFAGNIRTDPARKQIYVPFDTYSALKAELAETYVVKPAFDNLSSQFQDHRAATNPHNITKSTVGLGNVPNIDATNASNISSGTLNKARLPTINQKDITVAVGALSGTETTMDVSDYDQINFAQSGATNFTGFSHNLAEYVLKNISCRYYNSNTTMVHSAYLILKGSVNVTPGANQILTFQIFKEGSSYYALETGRNF